MNGRWWLCLPAVVFCTVDAVLTLLGQDREYWAGELARVNEMNPVGYALLRWHPLAFIGGIVVWVVIFCAALLHLPLRAALVCGLGLTVAHTFGAATWVVRWESPYGIGLMAGVALLLTSDRVTWTCWKYFRRRHGHALRNSHTSEDLKRMFAHDAWANAEMAATLRSCNAPPARAVALLAHIVAAQRVWWGRLHRESNPVQVWPELTLDQCEAGLQELAQRWQKYFLQIDAAALQVEVSYKNSAGTTWTSTVADILRHVALHGSYHRGQIATHLRLAGWQAPNTDFIHASRQGFLEPADADFPAEPVPRLAS